MNNSNNSNVLDASKKSREGLLFYPPHTESGEDLTVGRNSQVEIFEMDRGEPIQEHRDEL